MGVFGGMGGECWVGCLPCGVDVGIIVAVHDWCAICNRATRRATVVPLMWSISDNVVGSDRFELVATVRIAARTLSRQ